MGELDTLAGIKWALDHKHYELYRYLWGSIDFINVWSFDIF